MADLKSFMKTATDTVNSATNSVTNSVQSITDKISNSIKSAANFNPFQSSGSAGAPIGRPDALRGSNDKVENDSGAFAHKQTEKPPSADQEYQVDFQPNILDQFDACTYHWKLFITSLSDAHDGTVLERKSQTIIAETGVTDLTIEKVEINGIAVPSVFGGTGTQTTVKFQITEPSGAALLDKLYYQSLSLGIGNWLVMPCFLQLEFKGRETPDSEAPESGTPKILNGVRWVWPIKITNSKAHVSHVGTRYEFDGIIYDELAQSNSYFSILHNIALDKLEDTFESAITKLQTKIMEDQRDKVINGSYGIPDVYKFVIDPEIKKNAKIILPDQNQHTSRHGGDFINFKKKTASYNAGTGIDKIIDSLLGNTKYFQSSLQGSETGTSRPMSADKAPPMRNFWRIITESHPYAYDYVRQDNAVEITIYIVEYRLGAIETTAEQTAQTDKTAQAAKNRLKEYFSKKILRKRYDYIFTGLNDQVIQFDLNLNFSFAAALSRFNGIYYDTAGSDMGVVAQKFSKKKRQEAEYFTQRLRTFISPDFKGDRMVELNALQSSMDATQQTPEVRAQYNKLIRLAKENRLTNEELVKDAKLQENSRAKRSLAPTSAQELTFISDVDLSKSTTNSVQAAADSLRKGKLRPIPYREAVQENNLAVGAEPSSDAARARTSSVFATALYSSLDASLQSVKLIIKGDPYWLFPRQIGPNIESLPFKTKMAPDDAIKYIKESHIQFPDSVNFYGTDNFIVIRLRTPKVANDASGIIDRPEDPMVEVETFSGVYKVITLVNKFENGKFTQELSCILDPIINLEKFIQDIEASAKKTNSLPTGTPPPGRSQQSESQSNIPSSAELRSLSDNELLLRQQLTELDNSSAKIREKLRNRYS